MTVRINFLPRNYQPPRQMGAKEWGIAAAVAAALTATGVGYGSVYANTVRLEQETQIAQAQLQQVKAQLAHAEEIRLREQRVAQAEVELKALAGHDWSRVLLTLRELTPKHVTWTSLQAEGNDIVLKGTGRGLIDVAQLFGGLVDTRQVEQVALRYVDERGIPITITARAGEGAEAEAELAGAEEVVGEFRQLEFELVITLAPAEGRAQPHGA